MKEILIIRHGELENPSERVYNRDSVMKSEDIIHLSQSGRAQFLALAAEINRQNKIPVQLWCSPETRVKESVEILKQELGIDRVAIKFDLDDVYAPGPYLEGMTMKELESLGGDVYDDKRWQKYNHESVGAVTTRMLGVITKMLAKLKDRQMGALVSHGDPIAFLLNYLRLGVMADPAKIRNMMYPPKGSAILLRFDFAGKFLSMENFRGDMLWSGSNY